VRWGASINISITYSPKKLDGWRRHYNMLLIIFPKLFNLPFFCFCSTFFFIWCKFLWLMSKENVRGRCECKSIWWENKGRHQWYNGCGKYKLLFLCKHIQNKYQNYFKLLVFKSTNNSFTSSLGRSFTYKYWLDLLCKFLIPFSFFHLTFTSCTTYKLVFSKNIQTWKEWYTLKIRRKENVGPFPFKTPFEQQY
jgi:hypothetical protein